MPTFQYEAMDNTGTEVKDTIDAPSEAEAQTMIKSKGFYVTKISEKGTKKAGAKGKGGAKSAPVKKKIAPRKKSRFAFGSVSQKKLCTFTRQLSTLQDAGLPILRSLRILEGQSKPGILKNSLAGVIEDVESGNTLSEAMAKQPRCFDSLYVNMVKAGEAGGALEVILQRLAEFKERAQSLKRKVQGAMIYPCAVVSVATLIVGFIMVFIIPKFKKIFEDFGTELPGMTVALITMSDMVVRYFYLAPAIPFGLYLLLKLIRKNKTGAFIVDWIALRIPLMGGIRLIDPVDGKDFNLYVTGGPTALIGLRTESDNNSLSFTTRSTQWYLGFGAGAEYRFLFIDAGYDVGMTNMFNGDGINTNPRINNSYITAGLRFVLNK